MLRGVVIGNLGKEVFNYIPNFLGKKNCCSLQEK